MNTDRIRDFAGYVAIAVAFVLLLMIGASKTDVRGADVFPRWGGLVANTTIVFGYALRNNRKDLGNKTFKLVIGITFVAHVILFVWLLSTVPDWRLSWWIAVTPIEYLLLALMLSSVVHRRGQQRNSQRRGLRL